MSSAPTPPSDDSVRPSPQRARPRRGAAWIVVAAALLVAIAAVAWLRARGPQRAPAPKAVPVADAGAAVPRPSMDAGPGASSSAALPDAAPPEPDEDATDLEAQKAALVRRMQRELRLDDASTTRVRALFESSRALSQGNPEITRHPMTRAECRERRRAAGALPPGDARCGAVNMVPLYDPGAGQSAKDARVCIDQYEFPDIACEYPVVWVRADEAVALCQAVGKRICDAHEWEGACAGALKPPETEYAFGERRLMIEYLHNKDRELVWAYGKEKDHLKCATQSRKSPKCLAGGWTLCGSNTYPAGAFPECRSTFGVFDLHGNAAEHMNLPLLPEQLASRGGLGETEMKGSWFIFATGEAHLDDCRWRAPMWHKTRIDDKNSHRNYHLGFRCCRDL